MCMYAVEEKSISYDVKRDTAEEGLVNVIHMVDFFSKNISVSLGLISSVANTQKVI